ncbi:Hsp20/alpha crystallin family protein [Leptolyngbya iicbica]|uniref:Hsp20/alpha crystallin family protein n=2 Tax=Cyanophyceae TaxID=3028117 RepID=A0A4Q7EHG2_9CYAN|nr:Hsp20/alpha crystallin family protein [Leptolyngbya sp. LK]RZM82458.1 Hsp20/alpha crystallin family protein [Leptolyngbya sp. LK]
MIVRYWHPFQEVETLRRQLDSVFNEVSNAMDSPAAWTPAIRLVENEDQYVLTVQLSGIIPDSIDIQATRESIVISGERQQPEVPEGDRVLHDDIHYGNFRRVVNLPEAIQNDAVSANFEHGFLTLTLPKVEEVRNKVVKVSLKGQTAENPQELPEADA